MTKRKLRSVNDYCIMTIFMVGYKFVSDSQIMKLLFPSAWIIDVKRIGKSVKRSSHGLKCKHHTDS